MKSLRHKWSLLLLTLGTDERDAKIDALLVEAINVSHLLLVKHSSSCEGGSGRHHCPALPAH